MRVELESEGEDDSGEIVVHGHNVMQGYHNLPDENDAVFTDSGGFRTGDLGRIDKEGFLYIVGRIKEQYKLANGKYVVPTLIEEKISLSPYVANAMVWGDNKPFNVALIVPDQAAIERWAKDNGVNATGAELLEVPQLKALIADEIEQATQSVAGYERVRDFALIDEDFTTENGMLTPTLKVKRRVVLERYADVLERLYPAT